MMKKKTVNLRIRESKSQTKREWLITQIANAFLASGVAQIPLRDLAKLLDTSDRMLLYYFDDKADLVQAAISEVSSRLGAILEASFRAGKHRPSEVLKRATQILASPAAVPYMNVWADLSARGGRGEEPFRTIARQSIQGWLAWCDARLAISDPGTRRLISSAVLAVVEGVRLLESASPGSTRGVTDFLSGNFAEFDRGS
jgi:AcrR family transcriptional regulator